MLVLPLDYLLVPKRNKSLRLCFKTVWYVFWNAPPSTLQQPIDQCDYVPFYDLVEDLSPINPCLCAFSRFVSISVCIPPHKTFQMWWSWGNSTRTGEHFSNLYRWKGPWQCWKRWSKKRSFQICKASWPGNRQWNSSVFAGLWGDSVDLDTLAMSLPVAVVMSIQTSQSHSVDHQMKRCESLVYHWG